MALMYCGFNGFGQCPEKASNVQNTIVLPLKGNEDVCKPILYHHPLEGESNDAVKIFLDWSRCILSTDKGVMVRGFWNDVSNFEGTICGEGISFKQIVCTENVAVAINQHGQLVKLSFNSKTAADSKSHWETVLTEHSNESNENKALLSLKFIKIASNDHCILALDENGRIHVPPIKLDCAYSVEFVDIACGKEHFMALAKDGTVFTWGSGRGQLGHGSIDSVDYPQEVQALGGVRIVQIACGGWHSCALSESGDLYVWGWNECGQLGLPCRNPAIEEAGSSCPKSDRRECVSIQSEPRLLDPDNEALPFQVDVTSIGCGARHTAVTLRDKSGWAWGWNGSGQLGTGDRRSRDTPVRVMRDVDKVICGGWSTIWFSVLNSTPEN